MKSKFLALTITTFLALVFVFNINGQNQKKAVKKTTATTIEVIQFHTDHRCMTCNLIEKLTREALKESYPSITFKLINVDESKNEKIAEEFEATGTALFIHNPTTKKKKDLTDFAFMNAKSKPNEFKKGLKKAIQQF